MAIIDLINHVGFARPQREPVSGSGKGLSESGAPSPAPGYRYVAFPHGFRLIRQDVNPGT